MSRVSLLTYRRLDGRPNMPVCCPSMAGLRIRSLMAK